MNLGKKTGYSVKGQRITVSFEQGEAEIWAVTPEIINVFCALEDGERTSKAIEGERQQPVELEVEEREDGLWIGTGAVSVRVSDGFYVDFYDAQGNAVCMDYRGNRKPLQVLSDEFLAILLSEGHRADRSMDHAFDVLKQLRGDEHFYGLGDKTGFLDKRGYDYEMWNTDNPDPQVDSFKALYKSIPFFMALTGEYVYGIFLDNTYKSFFNMGQESSEYYYFGAAAGNLDYYYMAGDSLAQVLALYTYLTGTCPMPQKWTLGYHQSRWGYTTQEDVEEIAAGMRERDIPCDSIHFDIDYMQDYKVFTWNQKRYHGDPAGYLRTLADRGFKPVAINDPGVKQEAGYAVYEEGVEKGYFARTPQGEVYINAVWPGDAAFPDFGNPDVRRWWGDKQKFLLDHGVRGIWNDMNEPASFKGPLPDDVVFTDEGREISHAQMHNIYGHLMAKGTYEGLKRLDGRRPFVITRACYAGSQKYATCWTGDNHSIWAHLQMAIPQLCNLGLSGMPFAGTDVGGFGSDTNGELLARWVQVGCFSPLFRNHSAMGSRRQEPWQFGQEVLDIYRKYVKLRYHWIPYFYDLFRETEQTGAPVMRPLVYHYAQEEAARTCNDEFLLGDRILVAPVVCQGVTKRMVYLPQGVWYDYWTDERLTGPVWIVRDAPLDVCPIYIKAGSVIPAMEAMSYVGEKEEDVLLLDVYPGSGIWEHYQDNGEDFAYRDGEYNRYDITAMEDGTVQCRLTYQGYGKVYRKALANRFGQVTELAIGR
ncbi:MAG: glycoside hydrolase family 31 protein [bacterium]|nr:glycoside hydrolase family 31 protein [bacterium]MCM1374827.1 glycoside hydrolase family 31 protein [Muribaculum sp.]